ncbi:MAG: DNA repair protein RadC [Candidatus Wildermuthbacteria bacterium]|nr:DNA repair protein RadC [Candidatus Wildermuthbacteria bacterium]
MKQSFTVHDLPAEERPRERLVHFGSEALSAQELLALILGRGVRGESVMMASQKLLSRFGSLRGVVEASLEDLQAVKGLGLAKASQLKACLEMVRRIGQNLSTGSEQKKKSATSSQAVYNLVKSKIRNYAKEHFMVLSFDTRNKLIGIDTVSVGTLTTSLVHPRETFQAAIARHASHIIIAHNHPSEDPQPSGEDREITRRLGEAGKLLGINLVDHIIIAQGRYMSFKEQGLL